MQIQNKYVGKKGMFYVENEGIVQAKMVYHMRSPDNMVIEHTEVDDVLRGKNVGVELVTAAVEYARAHNIKITAWCPFAKKVFGKRPDFQDVLAVT